MFSTATWFWLEHSVFIFFMTFIHEDAAILAAAFSNVEHGLPLVYAYSSVYLGIVTGDILIYGLGRFAQSNVWLRSKIIGPKIEKAKLWLESNLVRVLVLCRITPGLLFPTFVACGWFKIPFGRFAIVSILSGAIYSSIVLTAIIYFGDAVLVHLDYWAWGLLFGLIALLSVWNLFKSRGKGEDDAFARIERVPSFISVVKNRMPILQRHHMGMPSIAGVKRFVSFAEQLPNGLFYIPVGLRWLYLSLRYRSLTLPTVSNPMIETGGFWGESKSDVMSQVGDSQQRWIADFVTLHRNGNGAKADFVAALSLMQSKGLSFPLVVKPDIGWQGYGVRLVDSSDNLQQYISAYPTGERMVIQRQVPFDGEAGIFYVRIPGESKGQILSVTLRYFPYVYGDGHSTLRALIQRSPRTKIKAAFFLGARAEHAGFETQYLDSIPVKDEMVRLSFIGSIRVGGLYRDAAHLITPELVSRFDEIAQSMPEFYYGRFDVRFESTEKLKDGIGFSIIEINGAGSEAISAWDPEVPFFKLYSELFKAQSLLFKVADRNRKRGFKPTGLIAFVKAARRQNKLIENYPPAS